MKNLEWFIAFVCLSASMALAQNAQLSGVVKDKTGAVVAQAEVKLKNVDTAGTLQTKTSTVGFFVFPSVQPGRYDLSAEAKGFDATVINGIKIDTAANVSQDLILQVKTDGETVTVVQKSDLNTTDGTVSTVVSREFIENLPLNGKDLTTLFELTPGTLLNVGGSPSSGGGFSVDGQRPTANYVSVDGVSANAYVSTENGVNNTGAGIATSASGGTNGILPIDAIEEYRMDTSTYTAENGRTPGGQIQVRTRSGTNHFHGTLSEDFRNQILDAKDWFTKYDHLTQSQLRMNQFGGTFGGPVIIPHLFDGRSKFFFFLANDNLIFDQPNTNSQSYVPDASILSGAYSNFKQWLPVFPSGNGGQVPGVASFDYFNASYPDLIRDHTTSIRFDLQLPKSIRTFFRANIAPSYALQPSISGEAIDGDGSNVSVNSYTGGLIIPVKPQMVDDLNFNYTSDNTRFLQYVPSIEGNTPSALQDNLPEGVTTSTDAFEFVPETSTGSAYAVSFVGPDYANKLHQWNIVDTLALHLGKSTLKIGADFLNKQSVLRTYDNYDIVEVNVATAAPYTSSDLDTGVISYLETIKNIQNPKISFTNTSVFVNNDWRAKRSLTFNAGVRWELNPAPVIGPLGTVAVVGDNLNPATFQAALSTQPLYRTVYSNFAPRFGFAWVPQSKLGIVVRGGAGIYFDTGQAATLAGTTGGTTYPYRYTQTSTEVPYASVNWIDLSGTEAALASAAVYLVNPHLLSPRTYEWSLTVDQTIGRYSKLNISYIGNDGEKLIGEDDYYNGKDAAGDYPVNTKYVTEYGSLRILTNQSHSNYQALQLQLTSRVRDRLNFLTSYTWSHAEDNGSSDFSSIGAAALNPIADSANDVRQTFAMALNYSAGGFSGNGLLREISHGWTFDAIARIQTALPITVQYSNTALDNVNQFTTNADVISGVPTVLHEHIDGFGKVVPGNKLLNWAAFAAPPTSSSGVQLRNGDSSTNGYRLFGLEQLDLAASRTWKLWRMVNVNVRVDAFNVLNDVNFAEVSNTWTSSNSSSFGRSVATYATDYGEAATGNGSTGAQLSAFQNGGPRELQLSMKLKF